MSKKGYSFNNFLIYEIPLIFMYRKNFIRKDNNSISSYVLLLFTTNQYNS